MADYITIFLKLADIAVHILKYNMSKIFYNKIFIINSPGPQSHIISVDMPICNFFNKAKRLISVNI